MNYKILAEEAFRIFSAGDPSDESGLEIKDFELAVEQARAAKIRYDYFDTYKVTGERTLHNSWLHTYRNVPVLFDEGTQSYYSDLPEEVLDLPHNLGIYHVSKMQDFQNPFRIQTIGELWLFSRNPNDFITFHYDADKIFYDNWDYNIKEVYMQIVPLSDPDIPDEFATEIINMVLNQFLKAKGYTEDKLTNGNPNKTETQING